MDLSRELANTLLELAPDATVVVDAAGTIVFANAQVESTFGYLPHELAGKPVEALLPARFHGGHAAHRAQFATRPKSRPMGVGSALFGQHKTGREFPVEISLSPVRSGGGLLVVAAVRDATARRDTERELIEANRAKSRLLAAASHDLRQPVQTLTLLNEVATRHAGANTALQEILERQQAALDTMAALLSSVLDIAKLDSGALRPNVTEQPLGDVFSRLRSNFEPHAAKKGLSLVIEPTEESARTDSELVRQLLANLLSNGIRYTDAGSVTLACRRAGDELAITVRDTGIGIPHQDLERIFEEFYQVDRGPTRAEGLGLGLSIVRRIAKLLQHRLAVESVVGKGTCFTLTVPRAELTAAHTPHTVRAMSPATGRQRVLVVDDEPALADATCMLLELEGFTVDVAHGMDDALGRVRAHAPDVIVSDFHLRGAATGTDVVTAIRTHVGATVPAIFVTGDTSKFARSGTKLIASCVLSKPTSAEDLVSAVRQQLDTITRSSSPP